MQQTTMNLRADYSRIALDLNRAALSQKLEEMTQRVPPRKRQRLADLLSSYTEKLRKLHAQGWTYRQLAQELGTSGLPVSVGALREHLAGKPRKRKPVGKNAARKTAARTTLGVPPKAPLVTEQPPPSQRNEARR